MSSLTTPEGMAERIKLHLAECKMCEAGPFWPVLWEEFGLEIADQSPETEVSSALVALKMDRTVMAARLLRDACEGKENSP